MVGDPHYRGNTLVLQTPHNTAVLVDRATKIEWVVDLWPRGYLQPPDVMTVAEMGEGRLSAVRALDRRLRSKKSVLMRSERNGMVAYSSARQSGARSAERSQFFLRDSSAQLPDRVREFAVAERASCAKP